MEDEKSKENQDKGKWGGKREGSGRPLHSKNPATIAREEVKRQFQERVAKHADRIFNAQLNKAVGEQVLMVKYTSGEGKNKKTYYEQVTDPETIKNFLDEADGSPTTLGDDEHWYYITTKPADNMAMDSLLNRSFGKADEKLDITSNNETIGKGEYDPETAQRFADFLKADTQ